MKKPFTGVSLVIGLLCIHSSVFAQDLRQKALKDVMNEKREQLEEADYACLGMSREEYLKAFEKLSAEYIAKSSVPEDYQLVYLYDECLDYFLFVKLKERGMTQQEYGECLNESMLNDSGSEAISPDQIASMLQKSTANVSESDIDLPLYPDRKMVSAFTSEQATQLIRAYVSDFDQQALASVVYTSNDDWLKIVTFYEGNLSGFQKITDGDKVLFAREYVDVQHLANPQVMAKWAITESILIRQLNDRMGVSKIEIHFR